MIKIDIIKRNQPGTVVETIEVEDLKSFEFYWDRQSSADYTYIFRAADGVPVTRRVIKETDGTDAPSREPEYLDLTDELVAKIAQFNENLTPDQVRAALNNGKTIYTHFSKYRLEVVA